MKLLKVGSVGLVAMRLGFSVYSAGCSSDPPANGGGGQAHPPAKPSGSAKKPPADAPQPAEGKGEGEFRFVTL